MQLFTLNHVPSPIEGKNGKHYRAHGAVCLETQQYPNAVNEPAFPSCVIRAGETASTVTELRFYEERTKEEESIGGTD